MQVMMTRGTPSLNPPHVYVLVSRCSEKNAGILLFFNFTIIILTLFAHVPYRPYRLVSAVFSCILSSASPLTNPTSLSFFIENEQ